LVHKAHQILEDLKLSTEYYICGNLRSATPEETYVNPVWTANMAVDPDRLTGFPEAGLLSIRDYLQ